MNKLEYFSEPWKHIIFSEIFYGIVSGFACFMAMNFNCASGVWKRLENTNMDKLVITNLNLKKKKYIECVSKNKTKLIRQV